MVALLVNHSLLHRKQSIAEKNIWPVAPLHLRRLINTFTQNSEVIVALNTFKQEREDRIELEAQERAIAKERVQLERERQEQLQKDVKEVPQVSLSSDKQP